jgi:hypothetical protein
MFDAFQKQNKTEICCTNEALLCGTLSIVHESRQSGRVGLEVQSGRVSFLVIEFCERCAAQLALLARILTDEDSKIQNGFENSKSTFFLGESRDSIVR